MSRLTIKQIAKAMKVSPSTVSKALSDSYEISEKTKQKIVRYAREHHYTPNRYAKNLKKGRTNTLGVVVCSLSNSFMSQVVDGIQSTCMDLGVDTLIVQSRYDVEVERKCIDNLLDKGIDGLLITPLERRSNYDLLQEVQRIYPVVLFDRIQGSINTHKIGVENAQGGYQGTRHLLKKGDRKVLAILAKGLGVCRQRYRGYLMALNEFRRPIDRDNVLTVSLKDKQQMDAEILRFVKRHLENSDEPTGVFCAADTISNRIPGILYNAGIKVPGDISIVGFTNSTYTFSFNPPLTTIEQPAFEIGKVATEKMLELLKDPEQKDFERIELNTKLVVRDSTL